MPKLLEKSKVAKAVGGPAMIRRLPKLDRLKIGLRIAEELGSDRTTKIYARKIFEKEMKDENYAAAIEIAKEHGLTEQLKEVSGKIADIVAGIYTYGADAARKIDIVERHVSASETAEKFGVGEDDLRLAALKAIERYMKYPWGGYCAAYIAKKHGLTGQMREAASKALKFYLHKSVIDNLGRVNSCSSNCWSFAAYYGLEEDAVKQIALEMVIPVFIMCAASEQKCLKPRYADTMEAAKEYGLGEDDVRQAASGIIGRALQRGSSVFDPHYHSYDWVRKELRIESEYAEAIEIAKEYGLFDEELKGVLLKTYKNYMTEKPRYYSKAIEIAEKCGFEAEKQEAILEYFEYYMKCACEDAPVYSFMAASYATDAAELAKKYGLADKMREAALKAFDLVMEEVVGAMAGHAPLNYVWTSNRYDEALNIIENYGLDEQKKQAVLGQKARLEALCKFDYLMGRRTYEGFLVAARFAKEYGLEEEMKQAARKFVEMAIAAKQYLWAAEIAEDYGLEDEKRQAAKREIEKELAGREFDKARQLAERFGLDEEVKSIEGIQKLL